MESLILGGTFMIKTSRKKSVKGVKGVKTVGQLKKKLDAVFSIYIRNRDKGECFTCFKQSEPKHCHAGHYVSRVYNSTRYDERNVHAQCPGCNIFKSGAMDVYALRLEITYGMGILQELNSLKKQSKSFKKYELEELIEYYGKKTNDIL